MSKRLVGVMLLTAGFAAPAHAQTIGDVCKSLTQEFRTAAVAVSQQAADVPAAIEAREALAPKEAAARAKCEQGGYYFTVPIDITKEDLDIALGRAVPACNAIIHAASPHVSAYQKLRGFPDKAEAAVDELANLRAGAGEACADYPGVMSRMLRVENELIPYLPKQRPGKPQ